MVGHFRLVFGGFFLLFLVAGILLAVYYTRFTCTYGSLQACESAVAETCGDAGVGSIGECEEFVLHREPCFCKKRFAFLEEALRIGNQHQTVNVRGQFISQAGGA